MRIAVSQTNKIIYIIHKCKIQNTSKCYKSKDTSYPLSNTNSWIGLPDTKSNIRPIKFFIPPHETEVQREYREARCELQDWHHQFWEAHNTRFYEKKTEFITEQHKDNKSLSPEDMSVFYKKFLDENYTLHSQYNKEWYKKNIYLLWPALKLLVEKIFRSNLKQT